MTKLYEVNQYKFEKISSRSHYPQTEKGGQIPSMMQSFKKAFNSREKISWKYFLEIKHKKNRLQRGNLLKKKSNWKMIEEIDDGGRRAIIKRRMKKS